MNRTGSFSSEMGGYRLLSAPTLAFHPERSADTSTHPLKGLVDFGPWSVQSPIIPDPIRIGLVGPRSLTAVVQRQIDELNRSLNPTEYKEYVPSYPGFSSVFRKRIVLERNALFPLDDHAEREFVGGVDHDEKVGVLLRHYETSIRSAINWRSRFDLLLVSIPRVWDQTCVKSNSMGLDFRAYLKAILATERLPSQFLREEKSLSYPGRCSVAWALGLAVYAKMGGIPWAIASSDVSEANIGIAYGLKNSTRRQKPFVTCCSQVFDATGQGPRFLAYEARDPSIYGGNPFLSRNDMFQLVNRSLEVYRRDAGGRSPERLTIHKTTHFTTDEVKGCFDAWSRNDGLELIQIQQSHSYRAMLYEARGRPDNFPVFRGTLLALDSRRFLLWNQGQVTSELNRLRDFQRRAGIPRPLLIRRFAGHSSFDVVARRILELAMMDFNSMYRYSDLPITITHAQSAADVFKQPIHLGSAEYQFRFFM